MLTAHLRSPNPNRNRSIESQHFRSDGSTIYDANGKTIAMQRSGICHADDGIFVGMDFESPVTIYFKNAELNQEEKFGPYPKLRIIDGGMWAFPEHDAPELLGQFDASLGLWHIVARPASGMSEFTISE